MGMINNKIWGYQYAKGVVENAIPAPKYVIKQCEKFLEICEGKSKKYFLEENSELLKVAYTTLKFEQNLVSTGGNKKGFINAKNRLTREAIDALKTAWHNFYSNNEENVIILNDGLTFQEASNTSVEMQLSQSRKSMNDSILDIFGVPKTWDWETFIKTAIMPILVAIECALNRDLLLEKEKKSFFFAFDTKEIIKGDIKTRFEAYKTALDSNLMQIDEVRNIENLEPLGLNFIKLGLQDVLFNPKTKEVYTPNTNQIANIENKLGGCVAAQDKSRMDKSAGKKAIGPR